MVLSDTQTSSDGIVSRKIFHTWDGKTHAVVGGGNFVELELKVPDEGAQNASDLEKSKLKDFSVFL